MGNSSSNEEAMRRVLLLLLVIPACTDKSAPEAPPCQPGLLYQGGACRDVCNRSLDCGSNAYCMSGACYACPAEGCPSDCSKDAANDVDGDGICDNVDNCPTVSNKSQADDDEDGVANACDPCPLDKDNDVDGDGVCGDVDNCPTVANPNQGDIDSDGVGFACDELIELPPTFADAWVDASSTALLAARGNTMAIGYGSISPGSFCEMLGSCFDAFTAFAIEGNTGLTTSFVPMEDTTPITVLQPQLAVSQDGSAWFAMAGSGGTYDGFSVKAGAVSHPYDFTSGTSGMFAIAPDGSAIIKLTSATQSLERWTDGAMTPLLSGQSVISMRTTSDGQQIVSTDGTSGLSSLHTLGTDGILNSVLADADTISPTQDTSLGTWYCVDDGSVRFVRVAATMNASFDIPDAASCIWGDLFWRIDQHENLWVQTPDAVLGMNIYLWSDNGPGQQVLSAIDAPSGAINDVIYAGNNVYFDTLSINSATGNGKIDFFWLNGEAAQRVVHDFNSFPAAASLFPLASGKLLVEGTGPQTATKVHVAAIDGAAAITSDLPVNGWDSTFVSRATVGTNGDMWLSVRYSNDGGTTSGYDLFRFYNGSATAITTGFAGSSEQFVSFEGDRGLTIQNGSFEHTDPTGLVPLSGSPTGAGGQSLLLVVGTDGGLDQAGNQWLTYQVSGKWEVATWKNNLLTPAANLTGLTTQPSGFYDAKGYGWIIYQRGGSWGVASTTSTGGSLGPSGFVAKPTIVRGGDNTAYLLYQTPTGYGAARLAGGVYSNLYSDQASIRAMAAFGLELTDTQGRKTYCTYASQATDCFLVNIANTEVLAGPVTTSEGFVYGIVRKVGDPRQYLYAHRP